jgi:hypothetical protein
MKHILAVVVLSVLAVVAVACADGDGGSELVPDTSNGSRTGSYIR